MAELENPRRKPLLLNGLTSAPIAYIPVRIRLALWYAGTLFLVLILFGAGTFYAMRASVAADYNRELRLRLDGIESFLGSPSSHTVAEIQYELSEDSELRPGGELLQLSDARGQWIYQSESIRRLHIPVQPTAPGRPRFATVSTPRFPVRLLSATDFVRGISYNIQIGQSLEQSSKLIRQFGWVLLGASPLLLLAAAATGYWMAKRALSPVVQITADARAITAFDISHRIKLPRANDELRDLSQTLNEMLSRLEAAFQRVTQFTADASHELRTPVALIRTTAELALNESSHRASREALLSILAESERTTDLLESLLTLARADANSRLPVEHLDCLATAREAMSRASVLASARRVSLTFSTSLHSAEMLGHTGSLRRLFLILIDNGLKYTPPGGSVQVRLFEEDHAIVMRIADSGIGISPEDLPHIFERFFRADKSRDRSAGVGLGLAIAEWLVKAHGASIHVSSVLDEGTVATLRFPALPGKTDGELTSESPPPVSVPGTTA